MCIDTGHTFFRLICIWLDGLGENLIVIRLTGGVHIYISFPLRLLYLAVSPVFNYAG